MPEYAIGTPSRELDEFEKLVYEYTGRMGLGNEGVSSMRSSNIDIRIVPQQMHLHNTNWTQRLLSSHYKALGC